jgi:murein DD-endopeptidase MepM/ murein hydrolase activator NlpD
VNNLAVAILLLFVSIAAQAFEVSVSPKKPRGGEGFLLTITGGTTGSYEISYEDKQYAPYGSEVKTAEIYLPVKIEAKGTKKIIVKNIVSGSSVQTKTLAVKIKKRKIKSVRLKEKDVKMRADEPIIQAQNQVLLDKIRIKSDEKLWAGSFAPPLAVKAKIATRFALLRKAKTYQYFHKGVDFSIPTGTPVKAVNGGIVVFARGGLNVYGNAMVVDHGQGVTSCYFHLNKMLKKEGDAVAKNETIAESGATGWATGPHLHFGLYLQGEAVDPFWWIKFAKK